jgi:hypothetical protein
MKQSRNLVTIAVVGALVVAFAGIGTVQYAKLTAYSGSNPNSTQGTQKQAPTCTNPRSLIQNLINGTDAQRPCPSVSNEERPTQEQLHGAPTLVEPTKGCEATSNSRRRVKCNEDLQEGAVQGLTNETNR